MSKPPPTPELDKMSKVTKDSQKIGAFLEWLGSEKIQLCKWRTAEETGDCTDAFVPIHDNIEKLLARYFGINLNKVEKERRAILKSLQE